MALPIAMTIMLSDPNDPTAERQILRTIPSQNFHLTCNALRDMLDGWIDARKDENAPKS